MIILNQNGLWIINDMHRGIHTSFICIFLASPSVCHWFWTIAVGYIAMSPSIKMKQTFIALFLVISFGHRTFGQDVSTISIGEQLMVNSL